MSDVLVPGPDGEGFGIYVGDARELSVKIPDNSVDLIFTDPPYHEKHLPLYGWLAKESSRIMKPGSWAFVYGGWIAKEVLELLCNADWNYFMTIALINDAGYPRWWSKKLMVGFKPVYVFTKGSPTVHRWQSNLAHPGKIDKKHHEWGQGVEFAIEKIDMFTNIGDLVVDFFCGGGQVPAACFATQRRWITFEIDPAAAGVARSRLAGSQLPLPIELQWSQEELELDND